MKYILPYLYILVFWFVANTATAQPTTKRDKIEALRVSFITQKVNFTTQEAQQFWPLYNEYSDKLEQNRKAFRQQYNKNSNYEFTTDKEAEAYLSAELTLKQKEYELYKEYYEKFKKILPVKKVALLRRAEEEFKRELIKNIKGNSPE
jgi:hypothetical protein